MAKFQNRVGGENIDQYAVPLRRNKTTLQAEIVDIDTVLALTDGELEAVIKLGTLNFFTAQDFRDNITDIKEKTQQQIRLWELGTQIISFNDILPTYLFFDTALGGAVQSKCGEEVGNPATNVLTSGSKWVHLLDEPHEIVLDLGNPEVIDGIAVRIDAGVNASHQLRGVDVFAAINLGGIDNISNQILVAQDFATLDDNNEVSFPQNKKARYVKLTNIQTDDAQNKMRIKNIKVRVIPKFFGEGE